MFFRDVRRQTVPRLMPVFLCGFASLALAQAGPNPSEEAVKAALVSRFPQFVQWPGSVWDQRTAIDLCVVRPAVLTEALQDLVADERIDQRPLHVREILASEDPRDCHVLYVPAGTPGAPDLLKRVATRPILTVSDAPDFLDAGGIVMLHTAGTRVRFAVDAAAADRAGLRLNFQLLRLATTVRGRAR